MGMGTGRATVADTRICRQRATNNLRNSTWNAIYKVMNLDMVFTAKDKRQFQQMLANPPEINEEKLVEVFGRFWANPRHYILKGLAEVFSGLDPFYKSHSNFGIGAKGLPKRIILNGWGGWGGYAIDKIVDMCQAMEQYRPNLWLGEFVPKNERDSVRQILRHYSSSLSATKQTFKIEQYGLEIRTFLNGNAHIYFNERALDLVNGALSEFYGEVLPDAAEEKPSKKAESTEVAKDLQFYRTPPAVVKEVLRSFYVDKTGVVLEPSCGDGAFLDALRAEGYKTFGVEVDPVRAQICIDKGHNVFVGNFLEFVCHEEYEGAILNPPFYGKHYLKHINKAIECLKVGGRLVAVLPAAAWYEHKKLPRGGTWRDLPVASFAESGTNIGTGYWTYYKHE